MEALLGARDTFLPEYSFPHYSDGIRCCNCNPLDTRWCTQCFWSNHRSFRRTACMNLNIHFLRIYLIRIVRSHIALVKCRRHSTRHRFSSLRIRLCIRRPENMVRFHVCISNPVLLSCKYLATSRDKVHIWS